MKTFGLVAIATVIGCAAPNGAADRGATATMETSGGDAPELAMSDFEEQAAPELEAAFEDPAPLSYPAEQLAGLPEAPWGAERIGASQAGELLGVWSQADNRGWCAPLVPAGLEELVSRATPLDGGWSLEVDRRGAPGIREDGRPCRRCGRAAFGIAGTSMPADAMIDVDTDEAPAPSYADGSVAEVAPEEEGVASATITVAGQGCVYTLWSFLGEEHLQELISELRFVHTDADAAVAGLDVFE